MHVQRVVQTNGLLRGSGLWYVTRMLCNPDKLIDIRQGIRVCITGLPKRLDHRVKYCADFQLVLNIFGQCEFIVGCPRKVKPCTDSVQARMIHDNTVEYYRYEETGYFECAGSNMCQCGGVVRLN